MQSSAMKYPILSAAEVMETDPEAQSLIQGSSSLAYACLLLRQRKFDLAAHLFQSLEGHADDKVRELAFLLEMQLAIETEQYALVKERLLAKLAGNPSELKWLSLLQAAISEELRKSEKDSLVDAPVKESAEEPVKNLKEKTVEESMEESSENPVPLAEDAALVNVFPYQSVLEDPKTLGFLAWTSSQSGEPVSPSSAFPERENDFKNLQDFLPSVPSDALQENCRNLEGGEIQKICFCFENLTITTLHKGQENIALITGNLSHSLVTIIRAENLFHKRLKPSAIANGRTLVR